ncbi:hypothetical protein JL475_11105 [Streptomyces sp. M2CJ-2]|uniref:hypothetical protein n=1 Tax=Streptomyces sp. M2CJ-2 TaxID=2803948 RepID=UPI001921F986|nr:hypothetical protein [Streptomyces sp. M2CJ-2]MBL3666528.1 hypothetical protein [Streptomyces sp. M2CJ-2]
MPADEVTRGTDVETFRVRTGPRHAAPKKPLLTRFHMPAGKAIALAAMPTAVLMGMGFTPTLAQAEDQPQSKNLTADEYKDCVAALENAGKDDASSAPGPSVPASDPVIPDEAPAAEPGPPATAGGGRTVNPGPDQGADNGSSSSQDSGSDDKAEPAPAPSAPPGEQDSGDDQGEPAPAPSETARNLLEDIGGAVKDVLPPEDKKAEESPSPTPAASADEGGAAEDEAEETAGKATETAKDTAGEAADTAAGVAEAAETPAAPAAPETPESAGPVTASPSPSASSASSESAATDLDGCPVATDAEGGVDNGVPLPDEPWFLNASSLLLKGADYQGIVEVRTASGKVKKVLKYVISDGTDIGDLHQTVEDKSIGRTYHVQAAKGSTSTIREGDTVMYTERISGKLLGLIPVTFDPENPPPLNIPLIYFTDVTVQQAGQFGGTLHVPGLHQYVT